MERRVLIIDDEPKMGKALRHILEPEGFEVRVAEDGPTGLETAEEFEPAVVLCDLKMPQMSGLDVLEHLKARQNDAHVIMMTAYASAETAVEAMKKGAYDYLIKPFNGDELLILLRRCLETQALARENAVLREQIEGRLVPDNVVAVSCPMREVLERTRKVAASEATVLISGESGTGKELVAGLVHQASARNRRPFLAVNCGVMTESLLESELFGHRRGAFTGAVENRAGVFEAADGGTLFLDEIGEISSAMQVRLLRVLESGEFQRVGESQTARVNVRVVAATNRDLREMVEEGTFRRDLFYRLNVVPLRMPALRERPEDIAPLVAFFLKRMDPDGERYFSPEALQRLQVFDWPGNVRELQNAVEHAVVLSGPGPMDLDALPAEVRGGAGGETGGRMEGLTLEQAERRLIESAMARAQGNISEAARQLGVTRRTLGYRLRKYGLYHKDDEEYPEEESS